VTLVVLLGWVFAFSDELHQYYVPNRAADPYDLLADMIGVLAGLIFYIVVVKKIYPRLKSA
jgi:VanZ family protein